MKKLIVALVILVSTSAFAQSIGDHANTKYLQMAYNYQIDQNNTILTIVHKLQPETRNIITYNEKIFDTVCVRLILQSKYGADLIITVEYYLMYEHDSEYTNNKVAKLSVKAKFNGEQKTYYGDNAKKVLMILSSGDDDEL